MLEQRRRRAAVWLMALALAGPAAALGQQSADDELQALRPADGMQVALYAAEPLITNPAAIDVDTHGRVWVAEIQWYRAAAKDPPADRIKVLEDTDGDGRADKATVFAEGLFCPMSICVAGPKVYVATSPDLWVYEDADGDLRADGPPRKLLTGFGGRNHDHGAHSLVLGPDQKWWMSHGDAGFNVTGIDGSRVEYRHGAMLRGELDGSKLETVAVNFRNPYEVCVSSFGEAYASDNDNDGNFSARICWIMEGGNYGWFGGPPAKTPPGTAWGEHWHFRGHLPGYVPATLVTGFGSPCGICFYEGDAFGDDYKNVPLHADAGPREVRMYRHEKAGAGMRAASRVILHSEGDDYFRPDDVCAAPDGTLLVADWYDGSVGGHAYNNPHQGRIFRLRPPGAAPRRSGKPGPYTDAADAIEGLKSPNLATQYLARQRLLDGSPASLAALVGLLAAEDANYRARALWVLDRIGGEARWHVTRQLTSPQGRMRALAVRILRRHGPEYSAAILPQAADPEPEVRREVLLALRTMASEGADAALLKLASGYDGTDRYLLEAIHIAAGDRKQSLAAELARQGMVSFDTIDLIQVLDAEAATSFLIAALTNDQLDDVGRERALARLGGMSSREAAAAVMDLAAQSAAPAHLRRLALATVSRNLDKAWKDVLDRAPLTATLSRLLSEPDVRAAGLDLIAEQKLHEFDAAVVDLARAADAPVELRAQALSTAARLRASGAGELAERWLAEERQPLRAAARAALVDLQAWTALRRIVTEAAASPDDRAGAAQDMVDSTGGALVLLRMIDDGALPPELREKIIQRATRHVDANIRVLFERFVPEAERPQRLGTAISAAEIMAIDGNAHRGRRIFFKSSAARCKACHRVNGNGSEVGPDLSQIGRKYARDALLETILLPSKAIAPEYVPYLLETTQGQVYAGFLVEKNDQEVVLKDAEGQRIRVPAGDVVGLHPQPRSVMPELVLQEITAQDAADLLAFLTSLTGPAQAAAK